MEPGQQQAYPDYDAGQEQNGARPYVREVNWRGGWPGLRAGESQTVALQRALDDLTGNGYRVVGVAPEEWNVWVRLLWAVVAAGTVGFVVRQPKVDVLAEPVGYPPTVYPDVASGGYDGSWQEYAAPGQGGEREYGDYYGPNGYDHADYGDAEADYAESEAGYDEAGYDEAGYDGGSRQLQYSRDYSEEEDESDDEGRRPSTGAADVPPAGVGARSRPRGSRPARPPVPPPARPAPSGRRPSPRPRAAAARTRELPPLPPAQARRLLSAPSQDDADRVIDLVDRSGGGEQRPAESNGRGSGRLEGFEEPVYDALAYDEPDDDEFADDDAAPAGRGYDDSAYDELDDDIEWEQEQDDAEDDGTRTWDGGVPLSKATGRDVGDERSNVDRSGAGGGVEEDWDDPDEVAYASMSRSDERDGDDGYEDAEDDDEDAEDGYEDAEDGYEAEPARAGRSAAPDATRRPAPRPPGRRPSPRRAGRPDDDGMPRRQQPTAGGRSSRSEAAPAEPAVARRRPAPPRRPAAPARATPGDRPRQPAPTRSRRPRPRG